MRAYFNRESSSAASDFSSSSWSARSWRILLTSKGAESACRGSLPNRPSRARWCAVAATPARSAKPRRNRLSWRGGRQSLRRSGPGEGLGRKPVFNRRIPEALIGFQRHQIPRWLGPFIPGWRSARARPATGSLAGGSGVGELQAFEREFGCGRGGSNFFRNPEIETLPERDSETPAFVQVFRRFDPLSHAGGVDAPGEVDQHFHDVPFDRVGVEAGHQRVGDLEEVRTQLGDGLERGVARPRVVDGDTKALAPERREGLTEDRHVSDSRTFRDLQDDAVPQMLERREGSRPRGQRRYRIRLHIEEEEPLALRRVVARRGLDAELLEVPGGLVLAGEIEEELGTLEGRVHGAAGQRLVPEDLHRVQVEDRLVDGPDAALAQDLLEVLAQTGLALPLLCRRDGDGLPQRPVHQALDSHLRVGLNDGLPDEDADPFVDAGTEGLVQRPAQRFLDLPRLALEARQRVFPCLERREDVEVRSADAVDGDEVFRGEDRPEHPAQRLGSGPQEAVEDLPAVGVLDVAVLLDVHHEDSQVAAVREAVPQRVDDDGDGRQLRDRVEEQVAEAGILVLRREIGRRGGLAPLVQELAHRGEKPPTGEGFRHVVVRSDLHAGDEIPDLALDGQHGDRNLPCLRSILQRGTDFPPGQLRHHDVQEDQVGLEPQRHVQAFPSVSGDEGRVSSGGEDRLDDQQDVVVIVDDENLLGGHETSDSESCAVPDVSCARNPNCNREGANQSRRTECSRREASRDRPLSPSSSMKKVIPTTTAPSRSTSSAAAWAVPPVASTSSTTRTLSPAMQASVWISRLSFPYSRP